MVNMASPAISAHCTIGPATCDECLGRTAQLAARVLDFNTNTAGEMNDAYYMEWLRGSSYTRARDLRERVVELCKANDLADVLVDMGIAEAHFHTATPLRITWAADASEDVAQPHGWSPAAKLVGKVFVGMLFIWFFYSFFALGVR